MALDLFIKMLPFLPLFTGIIGAIIGAWVSNNFQTKRILKEQKAQLLRDLMATRFNSQNDQRGAEAINYIPVLFANCHGVLEAYANYHDLTANHTEATSLRFNELVVAIANHIGIDMRPVDLMRRPISSLQRTLDDEDALIEQHKRLAERKKLEDDLNKKR